MELGLHCKKTKTKKTVYMTLSINFTDISIHSKKKKRKKIHQIFLYIEPYFLQIVLVYQAPNGQKSPYKHNKSPYDVLYTIFQIF